MPQTKASLPPHPSNRTESHTYPRAAPPHLHTVDVPIKYVPGPGTKRAIKLLNIQNIIVPMGHVRVSRFLVGSTRNKTNTQSQNTQLKGLGFI